MFRLVNMLYGIVAMTLAGSGVIAVLVAGATNVTSILIAAAVGALLALPVTYIVACRLTN